MPPLRLTRLAAFLVTLVAAGAATAQDRPIDPYRLELGQATGVRPDVRALAAAQARIMDLEEETRRLRGRIEEAEYRNRQLAERLERLERQSGVATGGAAAARTVPPPPPSQATPQASIEPPANDVVPDRSAREGNVLGSIPRDAVLGLPRPATGTAGAPGGGGNAASRYQAAVSLLQEGDYAAAAAAFDRYLADFPDDQNASSAAFWLGETYYFRELYADAAAVYARNYRNYGEDGPKAPENLLKLGMALSAMGDQTRACQTFAELSRRYPDAEGAVARNLDRALRGAGCG